MNCRFKLIVFLFLFSAGVPGKIISAQNMRTESVTIHQFVTPVLKEKKTNQIFQIKIETVGKEKPLSLREVSLEISGTDIKNDINEIEIYYSEEKPFLSEGIRFGIPETPNKKMKIGGHQKLIEGTNNFWVSMKLKGNANILNEVNATCLNIKINNKK